MKEKKKAQIANFNVVIGEEENPMLEYFDTYIYPAFKSDISRKENEVEYLLKEVELILDKRNEYVLVGKIVKKTTLEIRSDIDIFGKLIEKDEKHSSAPYSTFAIYLKNHRMVIVANQKGSPTLASFRTTIYSILLEYRRKYNLTAEKDKLLPVPEVKIVGIPSARTIQDVLKNVKKVNELVLRFYPLNGDIDFSGMFDVMTTELRKTVGSKRGETVLKSPKNTDGIAKVLSDANGTIDPILKVTTKENSTIRLKDYQITEQYDIEIDSDATLEKENEAVVTETENLGIIEYTNAEHEEIYKRNLAKIIKFVPK